MSIYKELYIRTEKGACFTNGNIVTAWKVNFGMPYLPFDTGAANFKDGNIASRYGEAASFDLTGVYPGQEALLTDSIYYYCVTDGNCLNGIGRVYSDYYCAGGGSYASNSYYICVNLSTPGPGYYQYSFYENLRIVGLCGTEMGNGTICFRGCVSCYSGDDLSIARVCDDVAITCYSVPVCGVEPGYLWVEGNDLHWMDSFCYEQIRTGVNQGAASNEGAIWIDNSHYLHWIGCDGNDYQAPWRICQFCSSFYPQGPGANPSPGASYQGSLWQNYGPSGEGITHLSYIGCDGNKYLIGSGCLPAVAP